MNKYYLRLMTLMFTVVVSVGFVSCSDGGDEPNNDPEMPTGPTGPSGQDGKDAMSPADQKEYLEKVSLELMDLIPASDFKDINNLVIYIHDTYSDYDWDDVADWGEDILHDVREALGTNTTEYETEYWGSYTYNYIYVYTDYKAVLMASNFTGHFTARNGRWRYEEADDLQFIFNDEKGQQCVLQLATSGSVKKVHVFDIDDWVDYDWQGQGNTYTSTEYFDRTQYTIGVPENIVVTLIQNGSQLIKNTVKVELGSISCEEFDLSKNSLTASSTMELNNGYKMAVSQVAYTANNKASISFGVAKNGISLVTVSTAADVNDIPSVNVSAFTEDSDENDYNLDKTNAKNAFVKLDILGKIQVQGTVSDVRKFADYLDEAKHNNTNEATYKSYINQANALTDINLFYNGTSVKQAMVKLEPFMDETWYGTTWTVEPVINFYDGSSYSTFKAFFNEKDFRKTIDAFKSLTDTYADLVD